MKNPTTKQRLKSYATLAGAALVVSQQANADIVYTDVFPDVVRNGGSFDVDMNNDGSNELQLNLALTTNRDFDVYNSIGVSVFASSSSAGDAYAMTKSSSIGASLTFNGNNNVNLFSYSTGGGWSNGNASWIGGGDLYLAVRFMIGANTHYGWVRLNVATDVSSFTIKDYAFENTPNTTILAGYKGFASLTEEELAGNVNIATKGNNVTIGVSDPQLLNDAEASLITTNGQTLASFPLSSEEQTVTVKEKGVLIVRIRVEDAVLNRKIYVTGN